MKRFKRAYGSTPLHLLAHVATFALAAVVIAAVTDYRAPEKVLIWFLGSLILHDALVVPFYLVLDKVAQAGLSMPGPRVRAINHVRIPALLSGLTFLVFYPTICGTAEGFTPATGLTIDGQLLPWLVLVALLFGGSAVLYAVRVGRDRRAAAASPRVARAGGW